MAKVVKKIRGTFTTGSPTGASQTVYTVPVGATALVRLILGTVSGSASDNTGLQTPVLRYRFRFGPLFGNNQSYGVSAIISAANAGSSVSQTASINDSSSLNSFETPIILNTGGSLLELNSKNVAALTSGDTVTVSFEIIAATSFSGTIGYDFLIIEEV